MANSVQRQNDLNNISSVIVSSAITVHKEMGPGLLESVYHLCLLSELRSMKLNVEGPVPLPLVYKGLSLDKVFVMDIVVEDAIVLELKAVEGLLPVHEAQLLSYLKLANKSLGFLMNFNVPVMKSGIRRFVNHF
jgi:GxxExxY protein